LWKAADPQHDASEEISTGIDTSILYSIHIAHHVRMSLKLISEETKQGIGQLTPAFEKTAADLSLDVQTKQGIGQLTPAFEKTATDLSLDVQTKQGIGQLTPAVQPLPPSSHNNAG
jgi:hypothetical protein